MLANGPVKTVLQSFDFCNAVVTKNAKKHWASLNFQTVQVLT